MRLVVKRKEFGNDYTVGELFLDDTWQAYTLEDKVREIDNCPVVKWKIPGQTAIPVGTYDLVVDYSIRFKRLMPHVLNVPGFTGVRIHPGNTDHDTEGCILVGWSHTAGTDFIGQSRDAFDALFGKIQDAYNAKEPIFLSVVNDPPPSCEVTA